MTAKVLNASFIRSQVDPENRSVPAVLSTETPVPRGGYSEVLLHKQNAIDLSRFPLPVLVSHRSESLNIAIAENPVISGGRLLSSIKFGESDEAKQLFADVQSGVIRNLSVGYKWLDFTETDTTTTVTRWQPYEVSLVSVPADQNSGFFRGKTMSTDDKNTDLTPDDTLQDGSDKQPNKRDAEVERKRILGIQSFGKLSSTPSNVINDFIVRGISLVDAKEQMIEVWGKRVDSETSRGDPDYQYSGNFTGGQTDVRTAIVDGLLLRSGVHIENPHPAARDFRNTSIRRPDL